MIKIMLQQTPFKYELINRDNRRRLNPKQAINILTYLV